MKAALVTTTINIPRNLEGYLRNFKACGHHDVEVIVIGDKKSPPETDRYLSELQDETGYVVEYWDVERQRAWLKDFRELDELLPYNSVQRRNLGYLFAVMDGADCIVSIDDDNFATEEEDYLAGHAIVGRMESLNAVTSSNRWFNSGSLLETSPAKPLYHRGFPTAIRTVPQELSYARVRGRVVVNAGMWLEVPDADAMSHLDCPAHVTGFRNGFDGRLAVGLDTNMVFNSQNTAFHRDLLPCMFLIPMGSRVGELTVSRYDDIWMSIFVKKVADHLGDYVTVGIPWARQERNDHDLLQDLLWEIPGMRITNALAQVLDQIHLSGDDYYSGYTNLVAQLRSAVEGDGFTGHERDYLRNMFREMETWAEACRELTEKPVGVAA